jgi:hypothetical protein
MSQHIAAASNVVNRCATSVWAIETGKRFNQDVPGYHIIGRHGGLSATDSGPLSDEEHQRLLRKEGKDLSRRNASIGDRGQ